MIAIATETAFGSRCIMDLSPALKCCVLSILARSIRHSHGSYWTVATILASLSMSSNRVATQVLFVFRATVLYWWPAKIYSLSGRRLT